jgi:hypothetical protein
MGAQVSGSAYRARRRAWELFVESSLSMQRTAQRLRAEGYALTNAGHPTSLEVEAAIRSEYRRRQRACFACSSKGKDLLR